MKLPNEQENILVAENVDVDMETLRVAQSAWAHPIERHRAQARIVDRVIGALAPDDRRRLEV